MIRIGMLRAPEGDGGEGGGAGGEQAPKALTMEDVNKAITGRLADFGKKQETSFKGLLQGFGDGIDKALGEKLEAFKTSLPQPTTSEQKAGESHKATPVTETAEYRTIKKQLDETAALVKASTERERLATEKERATKLRQAVAETLTKRGFDPARVRLAVGQLIDVDKRVRFDGDGDDERIVIKDTDGDVELEAGIESWAKTDEAKIYLPPRGSAGSGDRGGGKRPNGGTQKTEASFQDIGDFVAGSFPSMTTGRPR